MEWGDQDAGKDFVSCLFDEHVFALLVEGSWSLNLVVSKELYSVILTRQNLLYISPS